MKSIFLGYFCELISLSELLLKVKTDLKVCNNNLI